MSALSVSLDGPLPAELAVGSGSALFVPGWCFAPDAEVRSLSITVDGGPQPAMAWGMPRLDVLRALHPELDPFAVQRGGGSADARAMRAYRSGFWGLARIGAGGGERCQVGVRAQLDGGGEVDAELGTIRLVELPAPIGYAAPEASEEPLLALCMATYNPPAGLLERQLESIRAQTHRNWVCVVSDDHSSPERFRALEEAVRDDPRFVLSRSSRRLGFYGNFERALAMAPTDARYVALADQDDYWRPDKLATLVAEIGDAQLVYSDARIVDRDGAPIADSYWTERDNNHSSMLSMLVANPVTGAASLFRRELLDHALPFPPAQFVHYHDHWIGLTALALGDIAFVDRPLYDYVQHRGAALGHAAATTMPTFASRVAKLRAPARERAAVWRTRYFVDACRLVQVATILRMRCGGRMKRGKRRALDGFVRADRSLPRTALLALRGARELAGRPETLGAEWMLASAFLWRRLLRATARDRPRRRLRLEAVPPATLLQRPGRGGLERTAAAAVAEKVAPLELAVRADAPARVNVLIPTIDLEHFFGGYIAKLNLAAQLARRGVRTRIVTVDPVGVLPPRWRERLQSFSGLGGLLDSVEVAFGRESAGGLEVSPDDRFVATTWWTAHIADAALRTLGGGRFLYMIQEYEPFTFPMGTFAALATESYALPHRALFSTELLREYFRRHGVGVYADGADGDAASAVFWNAITAVDPPSAADLAVRPTRRLLLYARPEPHAARNMFELAVIGLHRALAEGAFGGDWELNGIGSVGPERGVPLGGGRTLRLLRRAEQRDYAATLQGHDVGLALMYTPHPSLVPIEMASAGLVTVTNSFENKTPEAMAAISSNLVTVAPTPEAIAEGLRVAAARADDHEARVAGSDVRWPRDWDAAFDDELMARIVDFLAPGP